MLVISLIKLVETSVYLTGKYFKIPSLKLKFIKNDTNFRFHLNIPELDVLNVNPKSLRQQKYKININQFY